MGATSSAKEELLRAACSYVASEKGDETNAHYGDQLDLDEEILERAVKRMAFTLGMRFLHPDGTPLGADEQREAFARGSM